MFVGGVVVHKDDHGRFHIRPISPEGTTGFTIASSTEDPMKYVEFTMRRMLAGQSPYIPPDDAAS